jgi:hypothetical protein
VFLDQLSETARANLRWNIAERLYGNNKGRVKLDQSCKAPDWERVLAVVKQD